MRVLADTHALLWFLDDDTRLSRPARDAMRARENSVSVSVASCWELAIKCSIGKIALDRPFDEFLWPQLRINNFDVLPVSAAHLNELVRLPQHHRDPFDRPIAAQALADGFSLVTVDAAFEPYGIPRLW